jgi:hypothetical protein
MTPTLQEPQTDTERAEVDRGMDLVQSLVGGQVVAFGGSPTGDIYLRVVKNGVATELIIGIDSTGDIALFEVEQPETEHG